MPDSTAQMPDIPTTDASIGLSETPTVPQASSDDFQSVPPHTHDGLNSPLINKQSNGLPSLPMSVANGGTGGTSLTAHGVLVGNGMSAVSVTGAGTSGQVLTSNGASADPTFQTQATPLTIPQYTYGTTITAGQAVAVNPTDGKVYPANSNDNGIVYFVGFANTSGVVNDVKGVNPPGTVDGNQSGLTTGSYYYLTLSGSLATSPTSNTATLPVGIAISATKLYIFPITPYQTWPLIVTSSGTVLASNAAGVDYNTNGGAYIKIKEAIVLLSGTYSVRMVFSWAGAAGTAFAKIYVNDVATGTERSTTSSLDVSEDITVKAGDRIAAYGKTTGTKGVFSNLDIRGTIGFGTYAFITKIS